MLIAMSKTSPHVILELLPGLFAFIKTSVVADLKFKSMQAVAAEESKGRLKNLIGACLLFNQLDGAKQVSTFQKLLGALKGKVPDVYEAEKKKLEQPGH